MRKTSCKDLYKTFGDNLLEIEKYQRTPEYGGVYVKFRDALLTPF